MLSSVKLISSELLHKQNYVSKKQTDLYYEIQRDIKIDGCSFVDGFLDAATCENLRSAADSFLRENPSVVTLESNGYDKRVYRVDTYTDKFNIPAIDEIANNLFSDFSFIIEPDHFMLLGVIEAGPNNLGSGSGWHRDSPFTHQFKTIVYLSDVSEQNGPFQYIKGTHKYSSVQESARFLGKKLSERRFTNEEIEKLVEEKVVQEPTTFVGKAGSLLIADTRGLHRGSPLKNDSRYALTRYHFASKRSDKFKL